VRSARSMGWLGLSILPWVRLAEAGLYLPDRVSLADLERRWIRPEGEGEQRCANLKMLRGCSIFVHV
jgi:hypothetical protein